MKGVLVVTIGGGIMGAYFFFVMFRRNAERRAEELDKSLAGLDLDVEPQTRLLLDQHYLRRNRIGRNCGAVAAGTGYGMGLMIDHVTGADYAYPLAMLLSLLAFTAGMASCAMRPVTARLGHEKVASLQPHGLREYLPPVVLTAECLLIVIGACAAVVGLWWQPPFDPAWALTAAGTLTSAASAVAVVMQARLVRVPQLADDEIRLVANDIVLVTGLRDLVGLSTAGILAGVGVVVLTATSDQAMGIGIAALVAVTVLLCLILARPFAQCSAPAAHQLAARQEVPA